MKWKQKNSKSAFSEPLWRSQILFRFIRIKVHRITKIYSKFIFLSYRLIQYQLKFSKMPISIKTVSLHPDRRFPDKSENTDITGKFRKKFNFNFHFVKFIIDKGVREYWLRIYRFPLHPDIGIPVYQKLPTLPGK